MRWNGAVITPESLAPRLALVAEVRGLVDRLASVEAPEEAFGKATALLAEAAGLLDAHPHRPGYTRAAEGALTGLGPHGELGPFTGAMHVFAPPLAVTATGAGLDRRVIAHAVYGNAYEGAPGMVHGGFILATFDEVLGLAQSGSRRMTARIEVAYRSPALLHRDLTYTGRLVRLDGRKAFVAAALHDGDTVCAEAEGLFIAPRT